MGYPPRSRRCRARRCAYPEYAASEATTIDFSSSLGCGNAKVGVKLVISLVVVTAAEIGSARSKRGQDAGTLLDVAGIGGVANTLVATLW